MHIVSLPNGRQQKRHQGIILISKTPSPPANIINYNIHMGPASEEERGKWRAI